MDNRIGTGVPPNARAGEFFAPAHAVEADGHGFDPVHELPDRRIQLTDLIRSLVFSGENSSSRAGDTSLHRAALSCGIEAVDPLCDLIKAAPEYWSLDRALELLNSAQRDHFAQLAILELVCCELGRQWCSDESNFVAVSVGTSRLQAMLRRISLRTAVRGPVMTTAKVLFLTAPGEQHTFGPSLLEELFRAQGWDTRSQFPEASPSSLAAVEKEIGECQVICFSWSSGALQEAARDMIQLVGRRSEGTRKLVLGGGKAALENRSLLVAAGFDYVCTNGYNGLAIAERFVSDHACLDLTDG